LASNLLIDIGPAVGGHGQRGIGRYVRGLAACIATFPDDLVTRIWGLGFPGPTLFSFGPRSVLFKSRSGLGRLPAWASGRFAIDAGLKEAGAQVLHATDPQRPWTDRAVPSVVTVYDLIPLREPEMLRSWRLDHQVVYRWYLRQIGSAARIIAISRTTAEDIQERLRIPSERIEVVYPVVDPPPTIDRIQPPEPTFLVVGALDIHKQPELALRAFGRFRADHGFGRLRYIGPSNATQERRLGELAAQLGVTRSVSIEGWISDVDLESAYAAATALISTSRIEGFGLPPLEAALRGVPVIAVRTAAAIETLEGAAAIVPADANAIAEAMSHPAKPPRAAVAALRDRYSIGRSARALAGIYRSLMP
jgi:glycosyltransferase involved in cell wall biosynthesis